jgi:hypothetical protein
MRAIRTNQDDGTDFPNSGPVWRLGVGVTLLVGFRPEATWISHPSRIIGTGTLRDWEPGTAFGNWHSEHLWIIGTEDSTEQSTLT